MNGVTHTDFWVGLFLLFSQLWLMCGLVLAREERRPLGVAFGCAWLGVLIYVEAARA